jgi:hypothetical protein
VKAAGCHSQDADGKRGTAPIDAGHGAFEAFEQSDCNRWSQRLMRPSLR